MQLRDYIQKHGLTQAAFGQLLTPPVSQGKVNHWIQGSRRVSLDEALQIERLTSGEVRPVDLLEPTKRLTQTHEQPLRGINGVEEQDRAHA